MQRRDHDEPLQIAVRNLMRGSVPGVSIVVARPDGVQWARSFGFADIAAQRPATEQTVYLWFSMTKLVTATCVMQLAESGQIGLDDPVVKRYEPFRVLRPTRWMEAVTVRHLLSHSSGLANPIPVTWIHQPGQPAPPPEAFLNKLLHQHVKLRFEPGSTASYSNLNYLLLGELIASAARQDYQSYVRQRVLEPLGMRRTGFAMRAEMDALAATPYQKRWTWMTPALRLLLPGWVFGKPADGFVALNRFYLDGAAYGGLIGPAEDAARFLRAHLNGGEVDGGRILTRNSVALMQTVSARGRGLDVGMGWLRPHRREQSELVEHPGGGGGYFNVMRIYPQARVGIVMMGNSTSYNHRAILKLIEDHQGFRLS